MAILPRTITELLAFSESHVKTWSSAGATIGLSAAQIAAVGAASEAAREAYNAAVDANNAKKSATLVQNDAIATLRDRLSAAIAVIRGFADNSTNPNSVYAAADLPAPATPSPAPAPGTPTNFVAEINQSGIVTLKWKCANPPGIGGTIYEVRRKIGAGAFSFIGASGVREFADDTLPAGSSGVVYEVTGVRSTRRGNPAQFNVNFGVGGGGGGGGLVIVSTSESASGTPMKMAA